MPETALAQITRKIRFRLAAMQPRAPDPGAICGLDIEGFTQPGNTGDLHTEIEAVGVAHVRPANRQCPDDRRRALCPEGAPWRAPTA